MMHFNKSNSAHLHGARRRHVEQGSSDTSSGHRHSSLRNDTGAELLKGLASQGACAYSRHLCVTPRLFPRRAGEAHAHAPAFPSPELLTPWGPLARREGLARESCFPPSESPNSPTSSHLLNVELFLKLFGLYVHCFKIF